MGSIDLVTENTAQAILEAEQQRNAYLSVMIQANFVEEDMSLSYIQKVVQNGLASQLFSIGDQIIVPWTDTKTDTVYDWPFDIVHFGDVELKDGETVPGMFLQSHYTCIYSIMFDQTEALIYCEEALEAGTYYFTIGTTWGSYFISGTSYYFTTTVDIPAGGQIRIGRYSNNVNWSGHDYPYTDWMVYTYESASSITTLESAITLEEGAEGTELGTTTTSIKYDESNINNLQRASYGYNRWSQSGQRQYLNSAADIGQWWSPQNKFDRPPSQLSSYPGYMSGFEDEFLNVLKPTKVTTALNNVTDSDIGTSEDTYDTFFLPSLEQLYIVPERSGVEGDYWEYWRRALGTDSPQKQGTTVTERIVYNFSGTASYCRTRSAYLSYAYDAWNILNTGKVTCASSGGNYSGTPACVIC